jgi:hypothetical protein
VTGLTEGARKMKNESLVKFSCKIVVGEKKTELLTLSGDKSLGLFAVHEDFSIPGYKAGEEANVTIIIAPPKARKRQFSISLSETFEIGKPDYFDISYEVKDVSESTVNRLCVNAPTFNFFLIDRIEIDGRSYLRNAADDAFSYNAKDSLPVEFGAKIKNGSMIRVAGSYTGLIPSPYSGGMSYPGTFSFHSTED